MTLPASLPTAPFQQLTGTLRYLLAGLRSHAYIVTTLGATADQVCRMAIPYKAYEVSREGVGLFLDLKRANLPLIAMYPIRWETHEEQIGEIGFEMSFGLQYLYPYRAADKVEAPGSATWLEKTRSGAWTDMASESKATHWGHLVLWCVRALLDNPTTMMTDSHIREMGLSSGEMMPPSGLPVRGWEAELSMVYTEAPWRDGPTTVDLAAIWGTLTEDTDDYAIQMKYETGIDEDEPEEPEE